MDNKSDEKLKTQKNQQMLLRVTVKSPGQKLFEGTAEAVSSNNERGRFDILPFHANFISLIKDFVIIHQRNKKPLQIPMEAGIVKAYENTIKILVGVQNAV